MLQYKYYLNTVTRTVSKHTATVLSCYHMNITLTQSHVPSVYTELQILYSKQRHSLVRRFQDILLLKWTKYQLSVYDKMPMLNFM